MLRRLILLAFAVLVASPVLAQEFFANRYPPSYTWAAKPACSIAGDRIFISDVAIAGSNWFCDGTEWQPSGVIVLARSAVAVTDTTNSAEFTLVGLQFPAGIMGLNRALEWEVFWSFTGSTNSKTFLTRIHTTNGALGTALSNSATTTAANIALRTRSIVRNRGSASSQYGSSAAQAIALGFSSTAGVTMSLNTGLLLYFDFNAIKATAGETVTLESYEVRLIP